MKQRIALLLVCVFFFSVRAFLQNAAEQILTETKETAAYAHSLIEKIRSENRLAEIIDAEAVQNLPVGINKNIGGIDYTIGIDEIKLKPTHAELTVYMSVEIPQNGKKIAFMAKNITFTKEGGLQGPSRLELMEDFQFTIDQNTLVIIKNDNGKTHVEWDCLGFKSLGISADIEFSRDLFLPDKPDGTTDTNRVTGHFETQINDWSDLIAEVDIQPFQVKGLTGVGFYVEDAVFDFSDINNPLNIQFPPDYQSTLMLPGNPNLWRGFSLKQLSIKLPPEIKSRDGAIRKEFHVHDLIIDNMGFTGTLEARNLIDKEQGDMNGWAYSLDSIGIQIQANQLLQAGFSGGLTVPIFKQGTDLGYQATIQPGRNYSFVVETRENIEIPFWKGTGAKLYPSSYIEVALQNNTFYPEAHLHGEMSIKAPLRTAAPSNNTTAKNDVELANVQFQDLQIRSIQPYVSVNSFSLGSDLPKLSKFPLTISQIGLSTQGNEVGIDVTAVVNLTGNNGNSFGGDVSLSVIGELDEAKDWQSWKYKRIDLSQISVNIDGGAFKINGSLTWFDEEPIYGNGFKGTVAAEFKPGITANATALFGSIEGMRYWYADAMATFPSGIPVFTGFGIYGFGGGAYYRMKQAGHTATPANNLGAALSGIIYEPDSNTYLGIKASVALGTHPSKKAFNGDATFEIAFNNNGGINNVAFYGNGYFMTPPLVEDASKIKEKAKKMVDNASVLGSIAGNNFQTRLNQLNNAANSLDKNGTIAAHLFISYDVPAKTLHGNLDVFVNAAGGVLKGTGPGGKAGSAVIHFDPNEWYIHIGRPEPGQYIGLELLSIQTQSYFMVGTTIPASPPPPQNVSSILGGVDLDYMSDLNSLGNGSGFAFGSSLAMNTGDLTFLIFYANFQAGLGFDVMLKDYGTEATCVGRSGPIGINGWYANGQAYAYVQGAIGLQAKLFGKERRYEILDIGAAAILQAKLPNPSWFRGMVGGYYNILGGLIKGNCKFEFSVGEECELEGVGSALDNMKVIAEITPRNSETDIDVFNTPQAVFNMPVNQNFELLELDGQTKTYRIQLKEFKLTQLSNSREIQLDNLSWNTDNDVLVFNPFDILPPQENIKAKVVVGFEEKVGSTWRPVMDRGRPITESMENTFTTGDAPDYIPLHNVAYAYPAISQFNFYKDEYSQGYIKLKQGQPYLFQASNEWNQKGRFTNANGSSQDFDFTYVSTQKQIKYDISGLNTHQMYAFDLVNIPIAQAVNLDLNVEDISTTTQLSSTNSANASTVEIAEQKAEGTLSILQEKSIFTSYFKTSQYNTFTDKINAISISTGWSWPIQVGIHEIGVNISGNELFDFYELQEDNNSNPPLIQLEANLANVTWYNNETNPLIYQGYPVAGLTIDQRDPNILGVPPTKAVFIRQGIDDKMLTQNEVAARTPLSLADNGTVVYNLAYEMHLDYINLRNKAANHSLRYTNPWMLNILSSPFPSIKRGNYPVKMKYTLPGTGMVTTEKTIMINNP